MKIRTNYISNSSSSSFLIYGENLLQTLINSLMSEQSICAFDYWGSSYCFTIKELNEEIINQCENVSEDDIKTFIRHKFYESIECFKEKIFYEQINPKRNLFIANSSYEEDLFSLNDELKQEIKNAMLHLYQSIKSDNIYDYYTLQSDKFDKLIDFHVNDIYNKLNKNNNELYIVSFGDNHGNCTGNKGYFVESEYLGNKEINLYLDEKINIIQLNEH